MEVIRDRILHVQAFLSLLCNTTLTKLADFLEIIFADSCLSKLAVPTVRYGISTNPIIKYIFVFFQVLPFNKNMLDNWVGDTIYLPSEDKIV